MDAAFEDDLAAVVAAAGGAVTKAILETSILTDAELARAVELAIAAGMDYIKTASGFNGPGATVAIIERMRTLAAGRVKIKAAGGIRTRADALAMIDAGAHLLGTSSGVTIMQGAEAASHY
jgi:deoxyribose-phosphate aldolase